MIVEIPLRRIPAQSTMVMLSGQACSLRLTRRNARTYCDLDIEGASIWRGLLCHDRAPLKRFRVTPLAGDFVFVDNEGADDPCYESFGTRHKLFYFTDDETLPASFQRPGSET